MLVGPPDKTVKVAIQNDLAFLLTEYDGLHIIGICHPAAPELLSCMSLTFMETGPQEGCSHQIGDDPGEVRVDYRVRALLAMSNRKAVGAAKEVPLRRL